MQKGDGVSALCGAIGCSSFVAVVGAVAPGTVLVVVVVVGDVAPGTVLVDVLLDDVVMLDVVVVKVVVGAVCTQH
jgi:hypothetical protein